MKLDAPMIDWYMFMIVMPVEQTDLKFRALSVSAL